MCPPFARLSKSELKDLKKKEKEREKLEKEAKKREELRQRARKKNLASKPFKVTPLTSSSALGGYVAIHCARWLACGVCRVHSLDCNRGVRRVVNGRGVITAVNQPMPILSCAPREPLWLNPGASMVCAVCARALHSIPLQWRAVNGSFTTGHKGVLCACSAEGAVVCGIPTHGSPTATCLLWVMVCVCVTCYATSRHSVTCTCHIR